MANGKNNKEDTHKIQQDFEFAIGEQYEVIDKEDRLVGFVGKCVEIGAKKDSGRLENTNIFPRPIWYNKNQVIPAPES